MADRAGGEGKPSVPKEVFELDKDERWQARLDEARARREVALREKAAGKPQKPRPKPWEVDGAAVEKPTPIEPVIQERGDDKFDFADRLETIRESQPSKHASKDVEPPLREVPPEPEPAPPEPVRPAAQRAPAPETRARPQPSLILPGAPDVADLAARYAATLEAPTPVEIAPASTDQPHDEPEHTAELVALPVAGSPPAAEQPVKTETRADRRRGIRPLGMAFGLVALAAMPFGTEAPPLETGPDMPLVDVFRFQPALGVTWSLYEPPVQTVSGEWVPAAPPTPLAPVSFAAPVRVTDDIGILPVPAEEGSATLVWRGLDPFAANGPDVLSPPETRAPAPPLLSTSPYAPVPPTAGTAPSAPVVGPDAGGAVSAPPRPERLLEGGRDLAPVAPPASRPNDTVVEGDPLRVTILAPSRADRALADDLARDVQNDGHELVRVRTIETSISERNVRFFHEADRGAAARMAERYGAELRDFTWFEPKPKEGTAELWLSGRTAPGNTSGRSQEAPADSSRSEVLNQVFESLGLGTELPEAIDRILPRPDDSGN